MVWRGLLLSSLFVVAAPACGTPAARALQTVPTRTPYWSFLWALQTAAAPTPTATTTPHSPPPLSPLNSFTQTTSPVPPATGSPTSGPTLQVAGLRASVTAGLLSCRYGPGPEYLYLYALREGANITLIGRADGDNWHWVWVEGRNRCWVNADFLHIEDDWHMLPVVYPGIARLPQSPYYPPTRVTSAVRTGSSVTVEWVPVPLRPGDEEDESMQHYILELWHCSNGAFLFEPLATNDDFITVLDDPGCTGFSRARLFVQEKHGFSGPAEVPWPGWH